MLASGKKSPGSVSLAASLFYRAKRRPILSQGPLRTWAKPSPIPPGYSCMLALVWLSVE